MKEIVALILFLSFGCREKEQKYNLPIEKEKLKSVLIDLYIAGAAVENSLETNKDSLKQIYHTEICKIHKINSKELSSIIEQLHALPKINGDLQKEILDTLNKMQTNQYKTKM
jgi:hypothetical protein